MRISCYHHSCLRWESLIANEHFKVVEELFGLSTNQGEAKARAERELKAAQDRLRSAEKTLAQTHRTQNRAASEAVYSARNAVNQAQASLSKHG